MSAHNVGSENEWKSQAGDYNDTFTIITTRLTVMKDNALALGARLLFCFLLDLSLNPRAYLPHRRGSIVMSMRTIALELSVSQKAVNTWKNELIAANYIWKDLCPFPMTWAFNHYHITALDPIDAQSLHAPVQGYMFGNGYRRPSAPKGQSRSTHGKFYSGVDELKMSNCEEKHAASTSKGAVSAVKYTAGAGNPYGGEPYKVAPPAVYSTAGAGTNDVPTPVKKSLRPTNKTSVFCTVEKENLKDGENSKECESKRAPRLFHTPSFENLDWKIVQRLRPKLGEKMIEDTDRQIRKIEDNPRAKKDGSFIPEAAAALKAYRERKKAVNAWLAGRKEGA